MTHQQPPRVSICIPLYNGARFVASAIQSVLHQTYTNFELIIIDNLSDDESYNVALQEAGDDPRVKLIKADNHVGMAENWNRCLALATGAFIKILCADDELTSLCIEKSVSAMDQFPEVIIVTCARQYITESGNTVCRKVYNQGHAVVPGSQALRHSVLYGNQIGEPTAVLIRRTDHLGLFDNRYKQLPDIAMWCQLLEKGHLYVIPEVLCHYRLHHEQITQANKISGADVTDEMRLMRCYRRHIRGSSNFRYHAKMCYLKCKVKLAEDSGNSFSAAGYALIVNAIERYKKR